MTPPIKYDFVFSFLQVLAAYDEVVKYAEQSRFLEETKNEDAPEEGVVVAEGATAAEVDEDPDNEFSNATTKHLNEGEVVMRLYGELFGGGYPTNPESFERGKTKINLSSAVQKRILYLPGHEFYLFDVVCETKIGGRVYFGMQEMVDLGEKCGFQFIAKPLHVDTFDNLLKLNPEFLTTIPSVAEPPLGEIKGNIAEGYVLRPMVNIKYKNSRLIFKLKHPEFSETAVLDKAQKEAKKMAFNATEVEKVVPFVMACMTTNRVGNISSHYDPAVFTAIPQGKLTFLLIQDAIKELIRENEEFAEMYNPKSFGQVKKAVEKEATAAIKAYQEEEQET